MTDQDQKQLGTTLWGIADQLRGAMNADDFRDYMLSFLFLRYLSDNYETAAHKELGRDYPKLENGDRRTPLAVWYAQNPDDTEEFEQQMRRKTHYVIKPEHLWGSIAELARTQDRELLHTLQKGFDYIENLSFASTFGGLFSEINLNSEKLGKGYEARNAKLCTIIKAIAEGLAQFSTDKDTLGDAYEYLIGQFAAGSGRKAGEFYTPQQISSILSGIVTLDSQEPATGKKKHLDSVLDFACGSGSLLLNVRHRLDQQANLLLYLEMHHTKTRKRRAVPLNHEARAALLNRARFRAEHCPASPWVFCDRDGQRIANVRRAFETACRRIGLADFGFTTYATLARHGW